MVSSTVTRVAYIPKATYVCVNSTGVPLYDSRDRNERIGTIPRRCEVEVLQHEIREDEDNQIMSPSSCQSRLHKYADLLVKVLSTELEGWIDSSGEDGRSNVIIWEWDDDTDLKIQKFGIYFSLFDIRLTQSADALLDKPDFLPDPIIASGTRLQLIEDVQSDDMSLSGAIKVLDGHLASETGWITIKNDRNRWMVRFLESFNEIIEVDSGGLPRTSLEKRFSVKSCTSTRVFSSKGSKVSRGTLSPRRSSQKYSPRPSYESVGNESSHSLLDRLDEIKKTQNISKSVGGSPLTSEDEDQACLRGHTDKKHEAPKASLSYVPDYIESLEKNPENLYLETIERLHAPRIDRLDIKNIRQKKRRKERSCPPIIKEEEVQRPNSGRNTRKELREIRNTIKPKVFLTDGLTAKEKEKDRYCRFGMNCTDLNCPNVHFNTSSVRRFKEARKTNVSDMKHCPYGEDCDIPNCTSWHRATSEAPVEFPEVGLLKEMSIFSEPIRRIGDGTKRITELHRGNTVPLGDSSRGAQSPSAATWTHGQNNSRVSFLDSTPKTSYLQGRSSNFKTDTNDQSPSLSSRAKCQRFVIPVNSVRKKKNRDRGKMANDTTSSSDMDVPNSSIPIKEILDSTILSDASEDDENINLTQITIQKKDTNDEYAGLIPFQRRVTADFLEKAEAITKINGFTDVKKSETRSDKKHINRFSMKAKQ